MEAAGDDIPGVSAYLQIIFIFDGIYDHFTASSSSVSVGVPPGMYLDKFK